MLIANINGVNIHYKDEGKSRAPVIAFANSLGSDLRLWDKVVDQLKNDFRIIRYDKRGHGLSDTGNEKCTIKMLADDLAALLNYLKVDQAIICGISVGGMIAQSIAVCHPELVKGLVLCDTGVKIGNDEFWNERISAINENGILAFSDAILDRWFSNQFKADRAIEMEGWRNMLSRIPKAGYIAVCEAIKEADLSEETKIIKIPTLCLTGDEDLSTPPELVEELAAMIEGAKFKLIEGAGHLPCIEKPEIVAKHLNEFGRENGYV
jgi:3-oxoadipate enol-lactonase